MDYLNRLEQDNHPETWHDYKPNHFKRPLYLIEAAELADKAWKFYDEVIEDELFSTEYEWRAPRYDLVEQARELAEEAAAHYSEMWERWSSEVMEKESNK